jgi:hypothetical protein
MRAVSCILISVVAAGVVWLACGGLINGPPSGYLDDAGIFHDPDGGVIFAPGSACSGYDAASFVYLPSVKCTNDDQCRAALASIEPPKYPLVNASCTNGGTCGAHWVPTQNLSPPADGTIFCNAGLDGDAYCAAYFGQFVLGGGQVQSSCLHQCDILSPENGPPSCKPGTDYFACGLNTPDNHTCFCGDGPISNYELCVVRVDGGAAECEPPCGQAIVADASSE